MNNKKGSISISINMIVVVVLAFVMLGLMLTLGRNIVNQAGDAANDIASTTQQQIMDDLQKGDKPLSFPKNEITVGLGDNELLAIGIKNTYAGSKFFKISIKAIDIEGTEHDVGNRKAIEYDFRNMGIEKMGEFQLSSVQAQLLGAGESLIIPIYYTAKKTPKDTMAFKLIVQEAESNAAGDAPVLPFKTYASKSFFITVV